MEPKILTIIGPTAVGKTALAIEIAKRMNGEVIGLDSRQIYFGMEIGTAQPTFEERDGIPHHLIGIRAPNRSIAAGEYANMVKAVIIDIRQRNREPIICGGAGLYYRALRKGIFAESISDVELRNKLEFEYDNSPDEMFNRLQNIDHEYSKLVHINNKRRLVRAMEIFESTGKTPSQHFINQKNDNRMNLNLFSVLLKMDKEILFKRICQRTEIMMENGFISEVKNLLLKYKIEEAHPMDSIGYKQVIAHLNGKLSYQEMVDEINIRTRQYVKKQMTWYRNEMLDFEIDLTDNVEISKTVEKIFSVYNKSS